MSTRTISIICLLYLLLLGALWVLTTGPWVLVAQSGDATVRNAIYESLVRDAWPLPPGVVPKAPERPFSRFLSCCPHRICLRTAHRRLEEPLVRFCSPQAEHPRRMEWFT